MKFGQAAFITGCAAVAFALGLPFVPRPALRVAVAAAVMRPAYPEVTNARLLGAVKDEARNAGQLREVFAHHVTVPEGYEALPIVNGRTMIVTTPLDFVYALDATTGKQLWGYGYDVPKQALRTACCDMVNRGVAVWFDGLYGNARQSRSRH